MASPNRTGCRRVEPESASTWQGGHPLSPEWASHQLKHQHCRPTTGAGTPLRRHLLLVPSPSPCLTGDIVRPTVPTHRTGARLPWGPSLGTLVFLHQKPKNYVSMSLPHPVAHTRRSSPAWLFLSSNIISIQQDGPPIAFFVDPFHPSSILSAHWRLSPLFFHPSVFCCFPPGSHVLAPACLCRRSSTSLLRLVATPLTSKHSQPFYLGPSRTGVLGCLNRLGPYTLGPDQIAFNRAESATGPQGLVVVRSSSPPPTVLLHLI